VITDGGAHAVQVVLADEQDRGLPERRQVERFVELAFGDRALAKEAGGDIGLVLHLIRQGQAHRQGQVGTDDGVPAVEAGGAIEQVHGAAAAAGAALQLAVHLRHDHVGADPARQGVPVLAVGGDHGVLGGERLHHTHGNGFFADVQVQETADLGRLVQLGGFFFVAPDQDHLAQHIEQVLPLLYRRSLG